jgi:hypothetical protein
VLSVNCTVEGVCGFFRFAHVHVGC